MGCASTVCRSTGSDDKNCVTLETRDENKIKLHTHAQLQSTLLGVAVEMMTSMEILSVKVFSLLLTFL